MVISGDKCKSPWKYSIMAVKGVNKIKQRIVPIKLKSTWVAATRLAETLAPIAAIITVKVVPMLSPKRIGSEPRRSKKPPEYKPCRIPMVADEA